MKNIFYRKLVSLCLIVSLMAILSPIQIAEAASLTSMSDTLTRLKESQPANHTIQFTTPTGIASGDTVTLTFESFNIVSVVTGDVTLEGAAVTSVGVVGQVLTITAGAGNVVSAAGVADIVISNNHITNPATDGGYTIAIAGTFGDTGTLSVVIANDDQVTITATVDPTLSFDVTDATVDLGTLSTSVVQTDTAAMTAATNATGGYAITVSGPTLTSVASDTIAKIGGTHAPSDPTGGEQFGMKIAVSGAGDGVAVDPYDDGAEYAYDGDVTADECAKSGVTPGPSATNTFTITYMANITALTEAGSYSATHTYICTGTF